MAIIVPTVTAYDIHEYRRQLEAVLPFAQRIHIDLMDGVFAPTKSPDIAAIWLPADTPADIHLMFRHPFAQLKKLLKLNPELIVVQAEADQESVDKFVQAIKKTRVKLGISLLAETSPRDKRVASLIQKADHVLLFSGHLGYHGGVADLSLLGKIAEIKAVNTQAEIGWDGGIDEANAGRLAANGIDVLNVGAAIQKTVDPKQSYNQLLTMLSAV